MAEMTFGESPAFLSARMSSAERLYFSVELLMNATTTSSPTPD
jgi:hypothetical protein